MNQIDISIVDELLTEISPEAACGDDLQYDAQFLEFELAAAGKPEVQYGDTITPAVPPDWKQVQQLAVELLQRSRDLRVAMPFSRALLHMQGFPGMAIGLQIIEQLLQHRWDQVHPQLDPDDDFDPMVRTNTLAALAESTGVVREVREATLINSRVHGRLCMRDIDICTGEQAVAEGVARMDMPFIEGLFNEVELEEVQTLHQALQQIAASVQGIETVITEQAGASQALNLSPLLKIIERARRFVGERLAARSGGALVTDADGELVAGEGSTTGGHGMAPQAGINTRHDVLHAIEEICHYYSDYEPSSPVPILLMRVHRLVNKNFLEIMEDMAPEGLAQAYNICGVQPASE